MMFRESGMVFNVIALFVVVVKPGTLF